MQLLTGENTKLQFALTGFTDVQKREILNIGFGVSKTDFKLKVCYKVTKYQGSAISEKCSAEEVKKGKYCEESDVQRLSPHLLGIW